MYIINEVRTTKITRAKVQTWYLGNFSLIRWALNKSLHKL